MLKVSLTKNKAKILSFLEKDVIWNSFAISDLEEQMNSLCDWYIAEKEKDIQALCLVWKGASPPVLHTFGNPKAIELICFELLTTSEVFLMVQNEHLPVIEKFYQIDGLISMNRFFASPLLFEKVSKYVKQYAKSDLA